ncbi:MAG: hypothetical protein Ct9H90mP22_8110 [Gammaproteobacteria bacterium]|nr:MAG: hypothetical protein Ct9H90mP22_8110 [Gammaproteobacteria bacterium]
MVKPSHVLLALGRSIKEAESSIRLSIGLSTNSRYKTSNSYSYRYDQILR